MYSRQFYYSNGKYDCKRQLTLIVIKDGTCKVTYMKPPDMKVYFTSTILPQDRPGQLATSFPDDDIKEIFIPWDAKYMGKENGRTRIQLFRWSNPSYGRILRHKDWKFRKNNPAMCSLKKQKEEQKKVPRKRKQ